MNLFSITITYSYLDILSSGFLISLIFEIHSLYVYVYIYVFNVVLFWNPETIPET